MTGLNPEVRYFPWPHDWLPVNHGAAGENDPRAIPDDVIGELVGVGRDHVIRLRKAGLDYWWADRLATKVLHRHPEDVFPNWRYRTRLALLMGDE